jgi:hypothetical protein
VSGPIDWRSYLDSNTPASMAPVPPWAWLLVHMLGNGLDRLENILMTAQDDINATLTEISAVLADVKTDADTLGTDLKAWVTANPTVDTSGLAPLVANAQAIQAALDAQVAAITTAVNPAPAPAPTPPTA